MSSQIEELKPLVVGKGCFMRLYIDRSKSAGDPMYNWIESSYDGKEDSDLLNVLEHWHQNHDEIMEVLEGRMKFLIDGNSVIVSAGDPPLIIPKGHVHGFMAFKGERVTIKESTRPSGDFKALFFQDMFQLSTMPSFPLALRVFSDWDTYISLPGGFKLLEYWFITIAGFIARPFVPGKPTGLKRKDD